MSQMVRHILIKHGAKKNMASHAAYTVYCSHGMQKSRRSAHTSTHMRRNTLHAVVQNRGRSLDKTRYLIRYGLVKS